MDNRFAADVWIVIPAYNERQAIGGVVNAVRVHYPHTVVVDDCSTDGTGALAAAAGAVVVRHAANLGQGAALQTGIEYALRQGASAVVTFDADGQHCPADIAALFAVARETGAAIVIGSRFLGSTINMPASRWLLLRAAVVFTRLTSGARLTDAHNGLRLLTREAASRIHLTQNRMAHASEFVEQAVRLKFKIAEAPVTIVYSEYSLRKGQKFADMFTVMFELLAARLQG